MNTIPDYSCSLLEVADDYFYEIISKELSELKNTHSYKQYKNEQSKLYSQYPRLETAIDRGGVSLNEEEVEALHQYISLQHTIVSLELSACYYKGMKDLGALFKKIDVLK